MFAPILYLVIPCFNEEEVLPLTAPLFKDELEGLVEVGTISQASRILFVDDGSTDRTWGIISSLAETSPYFEGLSLSRNCGHQNALLAGLMEVREKCDACISMDCDGQDDISVVSKMIDAYLDGDEVVYGVRAARITDTPFKRISAELYYKLLKMMGAEIVFNHADYRLLGSNALEALSSYEEANLFLRGLVPLLGFKSSTIEYNREERRAGSSHYPFLKMLNLATNGITSLSVKPIRLVSVSGALLSLFGFVGVLWALIVAVSGQSVSGWASTMCIVCFMGGVQLLSLGVIGEYVGKIYLEVKRRPRYTVWRRTKRLEHDGSGTKPRSSARQ